MVSATHISRFQCLCPSLISTPLSFKDLSIVFQDTFPSLLKYPNVGLAVNNEALDLYRRDSTGYASIVKGKPFSAGATGGSNCPVSPSCFP